jgi:ketosteroid isomerase-like protein
VKGRNPESEAQALRVLDEFMAAFNARDGAAFTATLNYPHVRIASGSVTVVGSPEEHQKAYAARRDLLEADWDHSAWDAREVIHSSDDKVHLAVRFTRYDAAGRALNHYEAIYIVTRVDAHWGVQARSSSAP